MNPLPRILFVSCMVPSAHYSASMAQMSALLERYAGHFVWFSLRKPAPDQKNPFSIPFAFAEPLQKPARLPRLKQYLNLGPWARRMGRQAAEFGRAQHVDLVLTDMAFEAVVAGRAAAQRLGLPMLASVQDPPVNRLRIKGYPGWLLRWYENEFAGALRAAVRCAVVSDYMGEAYQKKYGVDTVTLYLGVEEQKCLPPRPLDATKSPIVIGSVGSILSAQNWGILIEAVRLLNQKHATKFRILHIGNLPEGISSAPEVEVTGWVAAQETMAHYLARIDIGFLNYSFNPQFAETGRTSFPTKVHSYIQAQVPMLALGSADSTVVRFVQDHRCGTVCTLPEVESLAKQIESLVFGEDHYQIALQGVMALKSIFSRQQFFECFERFLWAAV
ncbi:MAG: glycosyltransferase [Chloroflexota bacterium]